MTEPPFELVRGSGNVFRDFNVPNPDLEQFRSILAAHIIKTLDARKMSDRQAEETTGVNAGDFSSIRRVKLRRFTVDKLMTILVHLGQEVQIDVKVSPRAEHPASAVAHP